MNRFTYTPELFVHEVSVIYKLIPCLCFVLWFPCCSSYRESESAFFISDSAGNIFNGTQITKNDAEAILRERGYSYINMKKCDGKAQHHMSRGFECYNGVTKHGCCEVEGLCHDCECSSDVTECKMYKYSNQSIALVEPDDVFNVSRKKDGGKLPMSAQISRAMINHNNKMVDEISRDFHRK